MKKIFQLSFTVFIIFISLVLGVVGNVQQKRSNRCIDFPVNPKTGLCVLKDCESVCKKTSKGLEGICWKFNAKGKDPKQCKCCGLWPPLY
ncbi:Defensin-like protein 147 [Arabidopsis thaliana]|uniref:Defensin-like protein 147 n=3 Tax=Arabidopsis TaxID=3701 RepID=DF147_ARATH|nr:low-molecular-weight cysteine-rich 1 [Arabidopsis thaliana]P82716.1 RecName: Full=Defensin-like protein 147; AltName: Full=Low-molecular-weight cysteine-rich protein 1; Short=Protein LCR1; Flags: Precursor [Arabidopsis thaliana]AED95684.1 low-molecular-weight cysteine-rich 1 [Arabidopsis thaliana]KAG7605369.1 S locus-related glycoprotein 1 binding pollen coat protein [Arabidopsis thaliana x Arabidopsis arenosa]OAO93581.1 LCR1 [Arabidopsis thaliana]|eukprot:NP_001032034.1 low-molecular-weight cysteine-rich 1 [Arabidopsis thaliana]